MIERELHADLDTPVSTYLKLAKDAEWAFLYESVEGAERWASYSIIGVGAKRSFVCADQTLTVTSGNESTQVPAPDPLSAIREASGFPKARPAAAPFVGGVFGYLAYDAVRSFEPLPVSPHAAPCPDACFFEPELLVVFDNRRHRLLLYAEDATILDDAVDKMSGGVREPIAAREWQEPRALDSRDHFMASVETVKEHIRAGDIIQAVISRRFELDRLSDPFDVYRGLRVINPSPYLFFLKTPEVTLSGASPEVMVRVQSGSVTVRPIAGTRPRGHNAAEDRRLADELLNDPKERAEHIMLVDLGRNDVGRVSRTGTVEIPDLMVVENYSHVMHIVSEVRGTLGPNHDAFDALRAAFPAGTLSGAPKVRAMQIIDGLENARRGAYGGAVGYFGPDGDADFGIAIRTLVDDGERFLIQAGAGIVADSDPLTEADETEHKAQAVLRAARWASDRASTEK